MVVATTADMASPLKVTFQELAVELCVPLLLLTAGAAAATELLLTPVAVVAVTFEGAEEAVVAAADASLNRVKAIPNCSWLDSARLNFGCTGWSAVAGMNE